MDARDDVRTLAGVVIVARLAYAVLTLGLCAGATSGWVAYYESAKDFDRAARKYRAAKAAQVALAESYGALLDAVNGADCSPCRCGESSTDGPAVVAGGGSRW